MARSQLKIRQAHSPASLNRPAPKNQNGHIAGRCRALLSNVRAWIALSVFPPGVIEPTSMRCWHCREAGAPPRTVSPKATRMVPLAMTRSQNHSGLLLVRLSALGMLITSAVAAQAQQSNPQALARQAATQQAATQQARPTANAPQAVQQVAGRQAAPQQGAVQQAAPKQPFPPLTAEQQAQLDQVLLAWQKQSQSTKTLECEFDHWKYDLRAAPAGVHAKKGTGVINYAAPDKGLFRTDSLMIYQGMKDGQPQYGAQQNQYGGYWVCNGVEVISYDRTEKECTILKLPKQMQGTQIFNSPLPFVFNSNAQQIKERYWVRMLPPNKEGTYLLEAWPKRQKDRAQYKVVQVALNQSFEPVGLVMYAPNFHAKFAPEWEVFEFRDVKRNAIGAGIRNFLGKFIPQKPPADWKIKTEQLDPQQIAQQPQGQAQPVPR